MTPEVKDRIEQIRHGNVPEGYKKGKYNVMPLGWSEEALSNLSDNITKGATPTTYGYTWVNDGVLFLKSDCVSDNGFVNREPVYISEDAHKMMNRSVVRAGDILISITGYLGKVGLVPSYIKEANINQHIARVRPLEDRCNPAFMYYYLDTNPIKRWFDVIQTGQAYPQLSLEQIREIKMPVPQITEQQRIAEILTAQDKVIELKEKRLAEKQRQKKYLVQQLLTGKKRLPGFDGEWRYIELGKIAKKEKGKNKSFAYNLVLSNSAQHGILPQTDQFDKEIASEDHIDGYYIVHDGFFVYNPRISVTAPCGPINRNETEKTGVMSPLYTVFSIESKMINTDFLKQYFSSSCWYRHMKSVANYGARHDRMNVSDDDFFLMPIPIPSIEEQTVIADALMAADKEIDLLSRELEQEKQKKKSLMQLLLTGIVRV